LRAKTEKGKTPLDLANKLYWRASDEENFAKIIQFLEDKEAMRRIKKKFI
jgi:hypothetical protein